MNLKKKKYELEKKLREITMKSQALANTGGEGVSEKLISRHFTEFGGDKIVEKSFILLSITSIFTIKRYHI